MAGVDRHDRDRNGMVSSGQAGSTPERMAHVDIRPIKG
jgi:hypothetical protein